MEKTIDIYNEAKRKEPDVLILMRCGDFYETYNEDAGTCGKVLGIVVTRRNGSGYALAGFPHHALDTYLPKLIRAGHRVRIIDGGRDTVFKADKDGGISFTTNKTSNNSNNNKTMATKKYYMSINCGVCYMFNNELQALVEVKPLREVFNLNNGESMQEWRVADTDKVMTTHYAPATETEPETFDGKLYRTFADFEHNKPLTIENVFTKTDELHVCSCLVKPHHRSVSQDENGAFFWALVNGEAVQWRFVAHIDVVEWHYNEKGQITTMTPDLQEFPVAYGTSEEVWMYNDYRFIDETGHETIREGIYKRLMLEPDQMELAKDLQALLDQCKEAGMCIYWSNADYTLNAVNTRRIERLEYDPEVDEETEVALRFDDSRCSHVFKNVTDLNSEDDSIKFVIKK